MINKSMIVFQAIGATFVTVIGTGMVCRAIPYKEGFGSKQLAWLAYSGVFGAVLAPMALMGGPLLIRAAWYTAGVVGGTDNISIGLIHCKMFFYFYIINVLVIHLLTVYILIISTKPLCNLKL